MSRLSLGNRLLLTFIVAALSVFSFSPFDIKISGVVSYGLFYLFLLQEQRRQSLYIAFAYGLGLFASGTSWVYISIYEHGVPSIFIAGITTLFFVLLNAILWTLPWVIWSFNKVGQWTTHKKNQLTLDLNRVGWVSITMFTAIWVLGEWSRSWLLSGFPWLHIGYSALDTRLVSWATVFGIYGVSFVWVLTGLLVLLIISQICSILQRSNTNKNWIPLITAVIVVVVLLNGHHWIGEHTKPTSQQAHFVMVQPNISQHHKWNADRLEAIIDHLIKLTQPWWHADLIIWPEAAIPLSTPIQEQQSSSSILLIDAEKFTLSSTLENRSHELLMGLQEQSKKTETTLISGLPLIQSDQLQSRYYNSLVAIGADFQYYHKQHLVPFGEYTPFRSWLSGLLNVFELPLPDMQASLKNTTVFTLAQQLKIAPAICYEIVFTELVRRQTQHANMIVTVSNDSWFGKSIGPDQHMQMARMRALENEKPLLRTTNNGITAAVDYQGNIFSSLPRFQQGVLSGVIQPRQGQSIYAKLGTLPVVIFIMILILLNSCLIYQLHIKQWIKSVRKG